MLQIKRILFYEYLYKSFISWRISGLKRPNNYPTQKKKKLFTPTHHPMRKTKELNASGLNLKTVLLPPWAWYSFKHNFEISLFSIIKQNNSVTFLIVTVLQINARTVNFAAYRKHLLRRQCKKGRKTSLKYSYMSAFRMKSLFLHYLWESTDNYHSRIQNLQAIIKSSCRGFLFHSHIFQ